MDKILHLFGIPKSGPVDMFDEYWWCIWSINWWTYFVHEQGLTMNKIVVSGFLGVKPSDLSKGNHSSNSKMEFQLAELTGCSYVTKNTLETWTTRTTVYPKPSRLGRHFTCLVLNLRANVVWTIVFVLLYLGCFFGGETCFIMFHQSKETQQWWIVNVER